jgi:membrane fusion protein (multidrug efflux system)
MKTSKIARWVLSIGLIAGLGYLVFAKITRSEKKKAANAQLGTAPRDLLVDGYVVKTENLSNILNANGTLLANEETSIQSEINARVIRIFFREGQFARKGAVLVKLYDADLRAQLQKLQTQKALAERTLERNRTLLAKGGVAQQQVDVDAASVQGFDADIAQVQAQIQRTEIRAPYNGTLGLRAVSEGTVVSPTTVIASFQQTNPLKLDFSVPEKYSDLLHAGDEVRFTVASDPRTHVGKVYAIEPQVDLTTRTVKLRAQVPNPKGDLRPGQFANVRLELSETPQAIMVPSQAIVPSARDKKVIVSRNGKAEYVTVETGLRNANKVQIIMGVQPGDTVITSGLLQIKPDASVKVVRVTK